MFPHTKVKYLPKSPAHCRNTPEGFSHELRKRLHELDTRMISLRKAYRKVTFSPHTPKPMDPDDYLEKRGPGLRQ
ncbi:uncharacterized protein FRV6_11802 [Fusarium oxysporum]|uniref:Uncharacterized protein n=1 Tax=Fusarium oxysporum TaxID=5507 RepID=A0A2H3TJ13_FUSOX|nr:uncharacterized protein FRV6_11802 [Fusarium oxysporum]